MHMRAKTNDPADWASASYVEHPVDLMEPLEPVASDYRLASLAVLDVLCAVDEFMCISHKGRPPRKWMCVSLAFGLRSTRGRTETSVALEWGVTRAAISKDVVKVLKLTQLENNHAWGLKSAENRKTYARTNGRRRTPMEV